MMADGMDEFIFNSKMIDYGDKEIVNHYLHQAVLGGKECINRKIFSQNLEKKIKKLKSDMGIDIKKMMLGFKFKKSTSGEA